MNHQMFLHYGRKNTGMELRPGMTFTIEPMINVGEWDVKNAKRWMDCCNKRQIFISTI